MLRIQSVLRKSSSSASNIDVMETLPVDTDIPAFDLESTLLAALGVGVGYRFECVFLLCKVTFKKHQKTIQGLMMGTKLEQQTRGSKSVKFFLETT